MDITDLRQALKVQYNHELSLEENARQSFKSYLKLEPLLQASKSGKVHYHSDETPLQNADGVAQEKDVHELERKEHLTQEEAKAFEDRVVDELLSNADQSELRAAPNDTARDAIWSQEVAMALKYQEPLVTEYMVSRINQQNLGWTAGILPQQKNMSISDGQAITGYLEGEADTEDSLESNGSALTQLDEAEFKQLPESLEAYRQYPQCRDVLSHVRNQGKCGSCWAQAAAYILETRLCIATDGNFSGPNAWFSSSYLTSCAMGPDTVEGWFNAYVNPWGKRKSGDGCRGGWASSAWDWTKKYGVPTGSKDPYTGSTCIPYNIKGDSLAHFDTSSNREAPLCPENCTNDRYFRSMEEDLYKLSFSWSTYSSTEQAKRAMLEGPIAFIYKVYQDFHAYRYGIYEKSDVDSQGKKPKSVGRHAVACFGYGKHYSGVEFLRCRNSWGDWWGEQGDFSIQPEKVLCYYRAMGPIDLQNSVVPPLAADSGDSRLTRFSNWLFR